jgi:tRNA A-37 threonylcarbamoyl transferase component Bud32
MNAPYTMVGERKALFGRYRLERLLSRGGMGEIYLASMEGAAGFRKRVCIKKILPHLSREQEFVDRFVDEAHIVVQLTHGNIVPVLDMGDVGGEYFIAMEYIAGRDLRDIIKTYERRDERMPPPLAAWVVAEAARALSYAHKKTDEAGRPLHITHRDVSPSNVLVSREGVVKLTDFGIAKAVGKLGKSITGRLQGKFCYMSPEQARGESVGPPSDQFSLAALAYELFTGVRPFDEETDLATLEAVRRAEVEPPSADVPELPEGVDAALLQALARAPAERFRDVAELGQALLRAVAPLGLANETDMAAELQRLYPEGVESASGARSLDEVLAEGAEALLAEDALDETVTASAPQREQAVLATPGGRSLTPLSPRPTPYPMALQATPSGPFIAVDPATAEAVAAQAWRRSLLPLGAVLALGGLALVVLYLWPGLLLGGRLHVQCEPASAQVYVGERYEGLCGVVVDDLPPGPHDVLVQHAGYAPVRRQVDVLRRETTRVELALAPEEPAEIAARIIIRDAEGNHVGTGLARRIPEGELVRSGDWFDIEPGTWEFEIEGTDGQLETHTLAFRPGENTVSVRLSPRPAPDESGGEQAGSGGEAEAGGETEGGDAAATDVVAEEPGEVARARERRREGRPEPARPQVTLTLTELPEGARVLLDGQPQRTRGGSAALQFDASDERTHTVVVRVGNEDTAVTYTPSDGDLTLAMASLRAAETRYIKVWVGGLRATVWLDDARVGEVNPPHDVLEAPTGRHRLRVVRRGEDEACFDDRVFIDPESPFGHTSSAPILFTVCERRHE